jgi:hypothetical protein
MFFAVAATKFDRILFLNADSNDDEAINFTFNENHYDVSNSVVIRYIKISLNV